MVLSRRFASLPCLSFLIFDRICRRAGGCRPIPAQASPTRLQSQPSVVRWIFLPIAFGRDCGIMPAWHIRSKARLGATLWPNGRTPRHSSVDGHFMPSARASKRQSGSGQSRPIPTGRAATAPCCGTAVGKKGTSFTAGNNPVPVCPADIRPESRGVSFRQLKLCYRAKPTGTGGRSLRSREPSCDILPAAHDTRRHRRIPENPGSVYGSPGGARHV